MTTISLFRYLNRFFILSICLMTILCIWSLWNINQLIHELNERESNWQKMSIEISRSLTQFVIADSSSQKILISKIQLSTEQRIIEPFYSLGNEIYLRKHNAFYLYFGDYQQDFLRLIQIRKGIENSYDSYQLYRLFTVLISIFLIILLLLYYIYFRFQQKIKRNLDTMQSILQGHERLEDLEFNEFKALMEALLKYRFLSLQSERQEMLMDIMKHWQFEVKSLIHDIKNPLQRIELQLNENPAKNSQLDAIKEIKDVLNKIKREEIIDEIKPETIYLSEFFEKIRYLFNDIQIDYVTSLGDKYIIDSMAFKRIASNLIQNALEADAKQCCFSFFIEHDMQICEISNNGKAINDPNKLFIPYHSDKKDGSGLGLLIVLQYVNRHKGKFFLKHSHQNETIFRMEIPFH